MMTVPEAALVHPVHGFMRANLDGATDDRRVFEAKTARTGQDWGEPGTDEVPQAYLLQVQHYMAVTGFAVADVAVLIGGSDFRIYEVPADPELQEMMIEAEAAFWDRVQRQDPPEPVTFADAQARYGRASRAGVVVATESVEEAVHRLADIKKQIKALQGDEDEAKAIVMAALGEMDIYPEPDGSYSIDAHCLGQRIRRRGFDGYEEAHRYLSDRRAAVQTVYRDGKRINKTLEQGATRLLQEKVARGMPSAATDAFMLRPLVEMLGSLNLRDISNEALAPFIEMRRAQGMKAKTINNALTVVNRICRLAATSWRLPNKLTWLASAPRVDLLELDDQRPPRPITWAEQAVLMGHLPEHLQRMALFVLNTGTRDDVPCSLEWSWEVPVKLPGGLTVSVFVVPREHVKGRKRERIVICNSVAQAIVDSQRGRHPQRVFTWCRETKPGSAAAPKHKPVKSMNNTAWRRARKEAGLGDLHVHDLRHTVGMRLRQIGVPERTQDDILWHARKDMTAHYSVAQIREIYDALEAISHESEQGETLNLLALMRRHQIRSSTQNLPRQRKTA